MRDMELDGREHHVHRTVLYSLLCLLMFSSSLTLAAVSQHGGDAELSIQQAMRAAYGNVDDENTSTLEYDGELIAVKELHFAQVYGENGNKAFLVTNEILSEEHTCHFCSSLIGFFVFEKADGRWKLSVSSKDLIRAGHWGGAPWTVDFVKIGPSSWALAINDGFSDMGGGIEASIALYRPDANGIHLIFTAITLEDGIPLCPPVEEEQSNDNAGREYCTLEVTELFLLPSSGHLYDLKTVTTELIGSKGPDGKSVPKVIEERYFRFDPEQNKYIPVDKSQTSGPAVPLLDENSNYRGKKRN